MDYQSLTAEITNDPVSLGYSGKTDQQVADILNTENRDDPTAPTTIPSAAIWNAIDPGEYAALSTENKAVVDYIGALGSDTLPVAGGLIRNKMFGIFNSASATRANIIALVTKPGISRAQEIGIRGTVLATHVATVRAK